MSQVSGDWLVQRMETVAEGKDTHLLLLRRPPLQWNPAPTPLQQVPGLFSPEPSDELSSRAFVCGRLWCVGQGEIQSRNKRVCM